MIKDGPCAKRTNISVVFRRSKDEYSTNFHTPFGNLCYNDNSDKEILQCSVDEGAFMNNNILFFLTPKAMCAYLYDDYTMRQALEKMESAGFAALPILNKRGEYRGTLTEGDLLWGIKNMCYMDMRQAEAHRIMEISRRKDNVPVRVTTSMHDLVDRASTQNFVPVVDDKDTFIGIVTRRAIIKYCSQRLFEE